MSEAKNDGGPAFPIPSDEHLGMTLRDYFAAKAMQGLMANPVIFERYGFSKDMADECAQAFIAADEMLKARQQ
jgi:hypothetical protein